MLPAAFMPGEARSTRVRRVPADVRCRPLDARRVARQRLALQRAPARSQRHHARAISRRRSRRVPRKRGVAAGAEAFIAPPPLLRREEAAEADCRLRDVTHGAAAAFSSRAAPARVRLARDACCRRRHTRDAARLIMPISPAAPACRCARRADAAPPRDTPLCCLSAPKERCRRSDMPFCAAPPPRAAIALRRDDAPRFIAPPRTPPPVFAVDSMNIT